MQPLPSNSNAEGAGEVAKVEAQGLHKKASTPRLQCTAGRLTRLRQASYNNQATKAARPQGTR